LTETDVSVIDLYFYNQCSPQLGLTLRIEREYVTVTFA
jgi:hypothetical protein